jgi:hypothetical protein
MLGKFDSNVKTRTHRIDQTAMYAAPASSLLSHDSDPLWVRMLCPKTG